MTPSKLKICGIDWSVTEDKGGTEHGKLFGKTLHSECAIFLCPNATPQRKQQTLVHEIVHVVSAELLDEKTELNEGQVMAVSVGLYQVLRDNPGLVAWLMESEPEGETK